MYSSSRSNRSSFSPERFSEAGDHGFAASKAHPSPLFDSEEILSLNSHELKSRTWNQDRRQQRHSGSNLSKQFDGSPKASYRFRSNANSPAYTPKLYPRRATPTRIAKHRKSPRVRRRQHMSPRRHHHMSPRQHSLYFNAPHLRSTAPAFDSNFSDVPMDTSTDTGSELEDSDCSMIESDIGVGYQANTPRQPNKPWDQVQTPKKRRQHRNCSPTNEVSSKRHRVNLSQREDDGSDSDTVPHSLEFDELSGSDTAPHSLDDLSGSDTAPHSLNDLEQFLANLKLQTEEVDQKLQQPDESSDEERKREVLKKIQQQKEILETKNLELRAKEARQKLARKREENQRKQEIERLKREEILRRQKEAAERKRLEEEKRRKEKRDEEMRIQRERMEKEAREKSKKKKEAEIKQLAEEKSKTRIEEIRKNERFQNEIEMKKNEIRALEVPLLRRRVEGKTEVGVLAEFVPKFALNLREEGVTCHSVPSRLSSTQLQKLKRLFKKAIQKFHPDRFAKDMELKARVINEETLKILQNEYDKFKSM